VSSGEPAVDPGLVSISTPIMNRNNVATVAKIWADLLAVENARFRGSFHRIVFSILDTKSFDTFKEAVEERRNPPDHS
jgi:hypothetical protein